MKGVSVVRLAILEGLENRDIRDTLVDQEKLVLQDDLVKMVPMEMQVNVPSVLELIPKKENVVTQEDQENVGLLGL